MAGCVTCNKRAAALTLPVSMMALNTSRCLSRIVVIPVDVTSVVTIMLQTSYKYPL